MASESISSIQQPPTFQPATRSNVSVSQIIQDIKSMSGVGGVSGAGLSSKDVYGSYGYEYGTKGATSEYYSGLTSGVTGVGYGYEGYGSTGVSAAAQAPVISETVTGPSQAALSSASLASSTAEITSRIADAVLRASTPLEIKETEFINILGESGILVNKEDIVNWRGPIPVSEYPINEDLTPEVIRKKTEQHLVYLQEVAIRYLRPPTPPPPGDIIIRQEPSAVVPPAPPLVIRQQPPRPETPAPLIVREAPPKPPHAIGQKIVTISARKLPPPPRKVIIERLPPLPSKPQSMMIERWLPYRELKRRVIFQRAAQPEIVVPKQKNVIIQWEAPSVEIRKEFKDLGVIRANPVDYVQRFGPSLKQAFELPDFVKQIRPPSGIVLAAEWQPSIYDLEGDVQALSLIDLDREGLSEYKTLARQFESLSKVSAAEYVAPVTTAQYGTTSTSAVYGTSGLESTAGVSYSGLKGSEAYTSGMQTSLSQDRFGVLKDIFSMIDVNADGYITINEIRRILLKINEKLGKSYGESDAQEFVRKLDRNGDGRINFDEFKQVVVSDA